METTRQARRDAHPTTHHAPLTTRAAALIVARREMNDVVSDWRIVLPALLLIIIFPLLLVIMTAQGVPMLTRRLIGFSVEGLVPFATMIVGFFPVSFSLMMALETFAGERERGSLESLFASPLSDRALYFGKLTACLVPPLIASYGAMAFYVAGVTALVHYRPDWGLLGALVALNLAQALVMVGAALIISSHTTSVRAANLLASFIILPMSLILQIANVVVIWGAAPYLWGVAAGLAVFAVLLLRMGLALFNREQVLTREYDELKGGQIWAAYRGFLVLPPRHALLTRVGGPPIPAPLARLTLRRLYLHDIPTLLRMRWPELLLVTVALLAAFAIGWMVAGRYPLLHLPTGANVQNIRPGGLPGGEASILLLQIVTLITSSATLALFLIILAMISFGTGPVLFMMLLAGLFGFIIGALATLGMPGPVLLAALALPQISFPALAFLLLTAFAARFGLAVTAPPPGFGLGESLLLAAAEYTKILALAVPLLVGGFLLQTVLFALIG